MPASASCLLWIGIAALALTGCAPTLSFWSGEPAPGSTGLRLPNAGPVALESAEGGLPTEAEPAFAPLDPQLFREAMEHFRNELLAAGVLVKDTQPIAYIVRVEAWVHAYRYTATLWESSYVSIGTVQSGQPLLILVPQYNEYPVVLAQRDLDWTVVILACGPSAACRDASLRPVWSGYFTFKESDFRRREAAALRLIVERLGASGWDCPSGMPEPARERCFWKDTLARMRGQ